MADKDLHAELAAEALDAAPGVLLRRLPGREVFALTRPEGGQVLVKRYSERLVWPALGRRSPAQREAGVVEELLREGFPVPAVLAVHERRAGWLGRRSVLLLEWIEHRQTLRELLREASGEEARHRARKLAELVTRLHVMGWHHRDLYLQHILVRAAGLVHSCPRAVPQRARLEFFVRYARGRGMSRDRRRHFLAAALAKERRMAAHTPRHGEEQHARGQGWTDR
jgi:hypothetical protein